MANSYYNFAPPFVPGTKVRSDEVNTQFAALEAAFDFLPSTPGSTVVGTAWLGVESGSGNSYVVTMADTRTSNSEGDRVLFKATHSNTGAATLNVDGLGALSIVQADGTPTINGDLLSGVYYEVVYNLASNHYQLQGPGAGILAGVTWAQEWAVKAEDSLISTAAGGNGVSDYSALHWAAKAADNAALTAADAAATAADAAATAADVLATAADVLLTNADAASTAADALATAADVVSTNADAAATAADALSTAADAVSTAADAAATAQDAIDTAADAAATAADVVTVAGIYDQFDDRYLGSKASDPTLDNDGDPLVSGALYWNTINNALRVYNGSTWQDVGSSTANMTTFTATAGQTTFSGLDDNSVLLSYTVGYLYVYLNGVLLEDTTDYTASTGTSVVLVTGATAGDVLQCLGFGTFDLANHYTKTESDARYPQWDNQDPQDVPIVMNGQFDIWQRGTTFNNILNTQFAADRWLHARDGSGATVNFVRNTWAPGHASNTWGAPYYAIFNCTVAGTGETYNNIQQRFEDVGLYNGQEITLSFVAHSPSGDQVVDSIIWLQNFGSGGSSQVVTGIASGTETISGSSWSHHSITFTPPSISGKTVGAGSNSRIVIQIATNSTFNVYLANVQIDPGPVAKPITRRDITTELLRCQRFYENSANNGTTLPSSNKHGNVGHVLAATVTAGNWLYRDVRFKVKKRTTPTVTLSTAGIAGGNGYINVNGVARLAIAADVGENGFGSIQNNSAVSWTDQQGILFNYEADAEL